VAKTVAAISILHGEFRRSSNMRIAITPGAHVVQQQDDDGNTGASKGAMAMSLFDSKGQRTYHRIGGV
jgi:hypothetical protein